MECPVATVASRSGSKKPAIGVDVKRTEARCSRRKGEPTGARRLTDEGKDHSQAEAESRAQGAWTTVDEAEQVPDSGAEVASEDAEDAVVPSARKSSDRLVHQPW